MLIITDTTVEKQARPVVTEGAKKTYDSSLRSHVYRTTRPGKEGKAAALTVFPEIKDNKAKLEIHAEMKAIQKVNSSNRLKRIRIPCAGLGS